MARKTGTVDLKVCLSVYVNEGKERSGEGGRRGGRGCVNTTWVGREERKAGRKEGSVESV